MAVMQEFIIFDVLGMEYSDMCLSLFWKSISMRLQLLSGFAAVLFTQPSTSVPLERVFSVVGWIRESRRSRLTPDNTELLEKVGHFLRLHWVPNGSDE